ncbi:MAG: hypothetical protein IJX89_00690 [Alphaproteobacteria bacterium]|nr:hypothetical protein [Alphaproteobacteria bacterium]
MSKYGVIQNVQNYSSNPFWTPNSPYNQKKPQAVYVQGVDVETSDCQRIVRGLVATECATRNNCIGATLSDVRPSIMVQLSRVPGHNYATACSGFIDAEFDSYVKQYANSAPTGVVAFPSATVANPNVNSPTLQIENPYQPNAPDWMLEMKAREQELKDLQSQNGAGDVSLAHTAFPATYADLSFSERMENASAGYEPYAGTSAYKTMKIETEEQYLTRQKNLQRLRDEAALSQEEFCKKYPDAEKCKDTKSGKETETKTGLSDSEKESLINRIIAAFPK